MQKIRTVRALKNQKNGKHASLGVAISTQLGARFADQAYIIAELTLQETLRIHAVSAQHGEVREIRKGVGVRRAAPFGFRVAVMQDMVIFEYGACVGEKRTPLGAHRCKGRCGWLHGWGGSCL